MKKLFPQRNLYKVFVLKFIATVLNLKYTCTYYFHKWSLCLLCSDCHQKLVGFYCFQYYKRRHKLCKVMYKSLCSKPVTQAQIANILQHSYVIIIIISWKTYLMRACACLALPIKKSAWRHEISNNHIFHMDYSVSFSLKASSFLVCFVDSHWKPWSIKLFLHQLGELGFDLSAVVNGFNSLG